MSYLYLTTLSLCFGACALLSVLAAAHARGQSSEHADNSSISKNAGLAAFALLGAAYSGCALLFELARGDAQAFRFQLALSILLPGMAYLFGQVLLGRGPVRFDMPRDADDASGLGVRLQLVHGVVAACTVLSVVADTVFDTKLVLERVPSEPSEDAAWVLHWGRAASLYLVWTAGVLGYLVASRFRASGTGALLGLVLYLCVLHDFAHCAGLGGADVLLQPLGVLAYLLGEARKAQREQGRAALGHQDALLRLSTQRQRLLLSAGLLQKQRLDSLSELASGIAHDINNPIQGIMNYASLLRMSAKHEPALLAYVDKIEAESDRVAKIARGILRLGRGEEQTVARADMRSDFDDILQATLALTRGAMRKEAIALELQVPPNLPQLSCEPSQVQQMLVHLIANAREALSVRDAQRKGEKTLKIAVELEQRAGQAFVRCSIEDNGDGMGQEVASQIFEPFFTTKEARGCAGLGLSLSRALAELHGGTLRLGKTSAEGTRMELALPCAAPQVLSDGSLERQSA